MPPASKKDCSVILFDLASKSRETAIQTLLKICCNNVFINSKDLTKLILLNSAITENRLNAQKGGFDNVYEVAKDVMVYDPKKMLEMIEDNSELGQANWLEGLLVALKNLQEEFEQPGIITYQILFITDLSSKIQRDSTLIKKVISGIEELDAFLYVVGPDIEVPFTIKTPKHIKMWMKTLNTQNENLSILKEIISQTKNSVVCNYKMGVHLFFSYRNWGGSQPWQVPLAIGSQIQIPAQTLKILNEVVQCKLISSQGAIREAIWIDAEDESIEIDPREVIGGIMSHEKFVAMPDNKMFQVSNPRGFSVLCFTDSKNVPEYLMRGGGCYCVLPNSTPEKNEALNILIDCLAKQNKYVIARRVYNNNYVPKIVVLLPKPDYNPKCFILTSLPYADDIRVSYREKEPSLAPKIEVNEGVYGFLDSINIENDKSEKSVLLGINLMRNCNVQRIVNKAADKLLDRHMNLEEIDIDLTSQSSGKATESLKNDWIERPLLQTRADEEKASVSDDDFDWD